MGEAKNTKRTLYGRVRFRIIEARLTRQSIDLLGEVESTDLFFDRDLTKPAPQASLAR